MPAAPGLAVSHATHFTAELLLFKRHDAHSQSPLAFLNAAPKSAVLGTAWQANLSALMSLLTLLVFDAVLLTFELALVTAPPKMEAADPLDAPMKDDEDTGVMPKLKPVVVVVLVVLLLLLTALELGRPKLNALLLLLVVVDSGTDLTPNEKVLVEGVSPEVLLLPGLRV